MSSSKNDNVNSFSMQTLAQAEPNKDKEVLHAQYGALTYKRSCLYHVKGKKFYMCNGWCNYFDNKHNQKCNEQYYRNSSRDHRKTYERTEKLICYLGPIGSPSIVFVVKNTYKGELPEVITKTHMKELYMAGFIDIAASLGGNCNSVILSNETFNSEHSKDESEKDVINAYFPTLQSMHEYFDYIETLILDISEKEECIVRDIRNTTTYTTS